MPLRFFSFILSLLLCACASNQDADQKIYDAEQARLEELQKVINKLKSSPNHETEESSSETKYTKYSERLRERIEQIGTKNYPTGLHGTVFVALEVTADGSVAHVDILRKSGTKELDDAAVRIGYLVSPFEKFSSAMSEESDSLVMALAWYFMNGRVYVHEVRSIDSQ